jgi:hypothetical protein
MARALAVLLFLVASLVLPLSALAGPGPGRPRAPEPPPRTGGAPTPQAQVTIERVLPRIAVLAPEGTRCRLGQGDWRPVPFEVSVRDPMVRVSCKHGGREYAETVYPRDGQRILIRFFGGGDGSGDRPGDRDRRDRHPHGDGHDHAMSPQDFEALRLTLAAISFSSDRMEAVKRSVPGNRFTTAQAIVLVDLFGFTEQQVEVATMIVPRLVDPENGTLLADHFTFSSAREKVLRALASRPDDDPEKRRPHR